MTRLLITGTSHTAMLRVAWDDLADKPEGLEVDFLSANAAEYPYFKMNEAGIFGLHDEKLVAKPQLELARSFSGTLTRRIADFSHVLIVGPRLNLYSLLKMLAGWRIDEIRETPADLPRLSQSAYKAFSHAVAWTTFPADLVTPMRPLAKLAILPAPHLSEAILTDPTAEPFIKAIAEDPTGIAAALNMTERSFQTAAAAEGVTTFLPPQECLAETGFTLYDYARGSVHIRRGKPEDHSHMNAEYGRVCLAQVLDWVAATPAQNPVPGRT